MTLEEHDIQSPEESTAQAPTELPPPPLVPVGPAIVEDDDDPKSAEELGDDIGSDPAP